MNASENSYIYGAIDSPGDWTREAAERQARLTSKSTGQAMEVKVALPVRKWDRALELVKGLRHKGDPINCGPICSHVHAGGMADCDCGLVELRALLGIEADDE